MTEEPDAIWVISDVAPDGTYVATVQINDDRAITLDRDRALAYAMAAITAAAHAEYDAAVLAQARALGMPVHLAASMVKDLRAERPDLDQPDRATEPLQFVPLITAAKGEPAIHVRLDGQPISQWTPDDTRGHAMHVLEILACVDLDAGYHQFAVGPLGLDAGKARALVHDLGEHRVGGRHGST